MSDGKGVFGWSYRVEPIPDGGTHFTLWVEYHQDNGETIAHGYPISLDQLQQCLAEAKSA